MKQQNKKSKRTVLFLTVFIVVVITGLVLFSYGTKKNISTKSTGEATRDENSGNNGLMVESNVGDAKKQELIQRQEKLNSTENQTNDAEQNKTVIITDAGQYGETIEVRAYIPDHYQDGDCITVFTKQGQKVEKTSPAYRDATTTICTNPLIMRSEFPSSGIWDLQVFYKAKDASGKSETKQVNIE